MGTEASAPVKETQKTANPQHPQANIPQELNVKKDNSILLPAPQLAETRGPTPAGPLQAGSHPATTSWVDSHPVIALRNMATAVSAAFNTKKMFDKYLPNHEIIKSTGQSSSDKEPLVVAKSIPTPLSGSVSSTDEAFTSGEEDGVQYTVELDLNGLDDPSSTEIDVKTDAEIEHDKKRIDSKRKNSNGKRQVRKKDPKTSAPPKQDPADKKKELLVYTPDCYSDVKSFSVGTGGFTEYDFDKTVVPSIGGGLVVGISGVRHGARSTNILSPRSFLVLAWTMLTYCVANQWLMSVKLIWILASIIYSLVWFVEVILLKLANFLNRVFAPRLTKVCIGLQNLAATLETYKVFADQQVNATRVLTWVQFLTKEAMKNIGKLEELKFVVPQDVWASFSKLAIKLTGSGFKNGDYWAEYSDLKTMDHTDFSGQMRSVNWTGLDLRWPEKLYKFKYSRITYNEGLFYYFSEKRFMSVPLFHELLTLDSALVGLKTLRYRIDAGKSRYACVDHNVMKFSQAAETTAQAAFDYLLNRRLLAGIPDFEDAPAKK